MLSVDGLEYFEIAQQFQSLSGNSSVVGIPARPGKSLWLRFNPFQGIQVLSDIAGSIRNIHIHSFNPFQGIQVLSGMCGFWMRPRIMFQSLSGNSSVVGWKAARILHWNPGFNPFQGIQVLSVTQSQKPCQRTEFVSIPFREFKCCRKQSRSGDIPGLICFNPFQGIQVLSGRKPII